jgi:hypothetical protein
VGHEEKILTAKSAEGLMLAEVINSPRPVV